MRSGHRGKRRRTCACPGAESSAGKGDSRGRRGSEADQNGTAEKRRGEPQNGHPSGAQHLSDEEVLPSFRAPTPLSASAESILTSEGLTWQCWACLKLQQACGLRLPSRYGNESAAGPQRCPGWRHCMALTHCPLAAPPFGTLAHPRRGRIPFPGARREPDLAPRAPAQVAALLPALPSDEYSVEPGLAQLAAMAREDPASLAAVSGFRIARRGIGGVRWLEPTDVRGLDIGATVRLSRGSVEARVPSLPPACTHFVCARAHSLLRPRACEPMCLCGRLMAAQRRVGPRR